MPIHKRDIEELRRLSTNAYDDDKRFINRVINGIIEMEREITRLNNELEKSKKPVEVKTETKK